MKIYHLILVLVSITIVSLGLNHSFNLGRKNGLSAGVAQITEYHQKDLIGRNLAVYDESSGKWTMLEPDQIVQQLIKNKKININNFTPIGISGIKECKCSPLLEKPDKSKSSNNNQKTISSEELFDGLENLDLEKLANLDKKLVAAKRKTGKK